MGVAPSAPEPTRRPAGQQPRGAPGGAPGPTPFYPPHLYTQQQQPTHQRPSNGQLYTGAGRGGYPPPAAPPYQQYPQPPAAPAEQTQHTKTIRNSVNLKKPTLKLVAVPEEAGKYSLQFSFDAAAPCWVSVFFLCREEPAAGARLTPARGELPARTARPRGLAQTFVCEELFDPSRFAVDDLLSAEGERYPLIVRLETLGPGAEPQPLPEPAGCALPPWVQSQTTYATLTPTETGWTARVVKQRIWVEGTSYELQEIYGIENCATGNAEEDAMAGKECVVCLSEARDTTVLPCRHMCMCSGCARMLRHQTNRCPICRTPVESLLEIKVERRQAAPPAAAAARPAT